MFKLESSSQSFNLPGARPLIKTPGQKEGVLDYLSNVHVQALAKAGLVSHTLGLCFLDLYPLIERQDSESLPSRQVFTKQITLSDLLVHSTPLKFWD